MHLKRPTQLTDLKAVGRPLLAAVFFGIVLATAARAQDDCPFQFHVAAPQPAPDLAAAIDAAHTALCLSIGAAVLSVVALFVAADRQGRRAAHCDLDLHKPCTRLK